MNPAPAAASIAIAAVVLLASVAWSRAARREGPDLRPRPDALEYGLGAAALASEGRYVLHVGDATYPPRYAPGFALLAAPFVAAAGGEPSAAWHASFAFGLAAVLAAALLGLAAAGVLGAACAGLIVAASPQVVDMATLAMSETASMALVGFALAAGAFAAAGAGRSPSPQSVERGGRAPTALWAAAGACIGAAVLVRYTNAFFAVPLVLFAATRHAFAPERRARAALLAAAPVAVACAALLAYHAARFGHPLHDGYRFWQPSIYGNPDLVFSTRYLRDGIEPFWPDGHLATYGRALLGIDGAIVTPMVAALCALGVVHALVANARRAAARLLLVALATSAPLLVLFQLAYFWQDVRFLLPLLLLAAAFAGRGALALRDLFARVPALRATPLPSAIAFLLVAALALHLAWPLRERIAPPRIPVPPPPLTSRLAALDADLPPGATLVVNFPVTLAGPPLGAGRTLIVADLATSDPHLNQIALGRLSSLDDGEPGIPHLANGAAIDRPACERLHDLVRGGAEVFYLHAAGEGPDGPGIALLRQSLSFEETAARPPLTVFRLRVRSRRRAATPPRRRPRRRGPARPATRAGRRPCRGPTG